MCLLDKYLFKYIIQNFSVYNLEVKNHSYAFFLTLNYLLVNHILVILFYHLQNNMYKHMECKIHKYQINSSLYYQILMIIVNIYSFLKISLFN